LNAYAKSSRFDLRYAKILEVVMVMELAISLMPLDAVAEAFGVSVYSVRRLIASGALPAVRIGARVLVSSDVVARVQREGIGPRAKQGVAV
jgi:excisionase family DNA binding protein